MDSLNDKVFDDENTPKKYGSTSQASNAGDSKGTSHEKGTVSFGTATSMPREQNSVLGGGIFSKSC